MGLERTLVRARSALRGPRHDVALDMRYLGKGYGGPVDVPYEAAVEIHAVE
ncbi:hypothetical protein [Streptomyces sp. Inha503]|uniref:hypothetical protein n=1 Tax=Streptomyces sp. Inha503 TaxID=3383314 RepID=UPI0039A07EBF